jgi:dUTP pyrophosphatase
MKIKLVRDVKVPSRGTSKSAGIDFFVPNDFEKISLFPGDSILIPSGVKVQVPEGHALIAFNKSGIATKSRLAVGASVVDEDYEGELHLHLYNTSQNKIVQIEPGMKITQFILIPVNYQNVQIVNEFESRQSERGSGGFGSTGIS